MVSRPTMARMATSETTPNASLPEVLERVERLLARYEELQRTNALLKTELEASNAERDSLRSRLSAARSRVDALIERLPASSPSTEPAI
jgi:cell division protein ZapB